MLNFVQNSFSNSQTDQNPLLKHLPLLISISAYCFILCPSWTVESSCRAEPRNWLLLITLPSQILKKSPNSQLPSSEGVHIWFKLPDCFTDNNPETYPNLMGEPTTLQIQPSAQQIQATRTLSHHEPKKLQTCRSIPVMNRHVQLRRAKSSTTLILAMMVTLWWFKPPHRQCSIDPLGLLLLLQVVIHSQSSLWWDGDDGGLACKWSPVGEFVGS